MLTATPTQGAPLGATVTGVDLHEPLSPDLVDQIRGLLLQHQVLFFSEAGLSPVEQIQLGQSFGVFWEYYGGPGATVTISITPMDSVSGFRRLGSVFRLGSTPGGGASLRIPDPAQPDGGPGRRLTLTMPEVKPGRYKLAVEVTAQGMSPARRELILRVPSGPPAAMR